MIDLLLRQSKALDQLDIAQGFGGRSRQRRRLFDDGLLHILDLAAQKGAQAAKERDGQQVGRSDGPVDAAA